MKIQYWIILILGGICLTIVLLTYLYLYDTSPDITRENKEINTYYDYTIPHDTQFVKTSNDTKAILSVVLKYQSLGFIDKCTVGWTCDDESYIIIIGESRINTLKQLDALK